MKLSAFIIALVISLTVTATSYAANYGNTPYTCWADTPVGRFECKSTNDGRQVLSIGGKDFFRTPDDMKSEKGKIGAQFLTEGIYIDTNHNASSCPYLVANGGGYVVYESETDFVSISQHPEFDPPPVFGILIYDIINFNTSPPTFIAIRVEAKARKGKKYETRFVYDDKGFVMHYYGAPYTGRSVDSYQKSKFHAIRFDYATRKVTKIK